MNFLTRAIDRSPMSIVALTMVLGIAIANAIGSPSAASPYYLLGFCIALLGAQYLSILHTHRSNLLCGVTLLFTYICLGALCYGTGTKLNDNHPAWPAQHSIWRGIVNESNIRGKTERVLLTLHSQWDGQKWIGANGQIECATLHDESPTPTLHPGDALIFKTHIEKPRPDSQKSFDYATYQLRHGINGQAFVGKHFAKLSSQTAQTILQDLPFRKRWSLQWQLWRSHLAERYQSLHLALEEKQMLQALTLGDKTQISKSLRKTYAQAGASHVLALSGLHLGILMFFLLVMLRPTSHRPIPRACIILVLLSVIWSFTALTGWSVSLIRASTMYSFYLLLLLQGRSGDGINGWATAATLLLIFNPDSLFDIGFQLSFIAVGAILLGMPFFQDWRPQTKAARMFYDWLTLSILAQAATLPLSLYYFHIVPTYALISSFIAIPCAYILLLASLLYLLLPFIGFMQTLLATIIEQTAYVMNHSLAFISQCPFATFEIHLSATQLAISYTLLLLFFAVLQRLKKAFYHNDAPYATI